MGTTSPESFFHIGTVPTRNVQFTSTGQGIFRFDDNSLANVLNLVNTDGTAAGRGVGLVFRSGDGTMSVAAGRVALVTEQP